MYGLKIEERPAHPCVGRPLQKDHDNTMKHERSITPQRNNAAPPGVALHGTIERNRISMKSLFTPSPINSENPESVKRPIEQDPAQILALVDLIFFFADEKRTIPS